MRVGLFCVLLLASITAWAGTCRDALAVTRFQSLAHLTPHAREQWAQVLESGGPGLRQALLDKMGSSRHEERLYAGYLASGYFSFDDSSLAFERQLIHLQTELRAAAPDPDDRIEPGFLFADAEGKAVLLPYGAEMDAGIHVPATSQVAELVNNFSYTDYLAQGFQVVQLQSGDNGFNYAQHDMAHLIGFVRNPEYMREVRALARARAELGPSRRLVLSYAEERANMAVFYVFEALSRGRLSALQDYFAMLGVPRAMDCPDPRCLKTLLKPVRSEAFALYEDKIGQLIELLGGGMVGGQSFSMDGIWADTWEPTAMELSVAHRREGQFENYLFYLLTTARMPIAEQVRQLLKGPSPELCAAYKSYLGKVSKKLLHLFCP